jgi:hypothetical protein
MMRANSNFINKTGNQMRKNDSSRLMQGLLFGLTGKNLVNLVVMLILPPATIILQTGSCIRETMRVM